MNGKVKAFLKRKDVVFSASRYGIDALGAMAQGLFASLLIGTILSTLGEQLGIAVLVTIGGYAKAATGPAMAVAIGYALKTPQLVLFSLIAVGAAANELGKAGGPLAVLVVAIVASECGKIVSKETKIDIIVTPAVTISIGVLLSLFCAPAIGKAASSVGNAIMWATELQPFFMGILVSVLVGVALTLPISSAAICAALGLTGLAGGAAVAGCCAQMIGFAVMSFKENKWGGLFAQGIGTSMLQMGNIVRNPRIWLPEEASEDSPAAYQKAVVKMLFTFSVSQTALMLRIPSPNTRTSVSRPQPRVIRCLSHTSRIIRTNMARNMISAKICAVICFSLFCYYISFRYEVFRKPCLPFAPS